MISVTLHDKRCAYLDAGFDDFGLKLVSLYEERAGLHELRLAEHSQRQPRDKSREGVKRRKHSGTARRRSCKQPLCPLQFISNTFHQQQ